MHIRSVRASLVLGSTAALAVILTSPSAPAQRPGINEEESKVPAYTLPDPLVCRDGTKVEDAATWRAKRRPELMELFASQVYGRTPAKRIAVRAEELSRHDDAIGGKAVMRQVRLRFGDAPGGPAVDLLIFVPKASSGPVPAFLGLNFGGNQAVHPDPRILLSKSWMRDDPKGGVEDHRATEASRGKNASRWPVATIVDRGYALVTAYYGDIDPDYDDGFRNGVHPLFRENGESEPAPDAWGSIGAWAWGLSRALDYLESDRGIDAKRVVVMGHSRLGKTALWAGAQDERFAVVISNNSGEGGAALARRRFGETTKAINTAFPHWFCDNFLRYNDREDDLPVDQHELIALITPRPVLVCSAEEDKWADPKGEFLAALGADPVYRLLGTDGMAAKEMPPLNTPILSTVGYHIRPGKHDVTEVDWSIYLDFADKHLGRSPGPQ
jgi:hypothetical protein